ncbi:MAG: phosphomannomutase/phosphoglucomutase [Actinobacteria bacterium]|nr:phosphomannomutase/phosphoglucomutase [Actinomycetota bacterium]
MAALDSAVLGRIFKAYDIRGLVPDELSTDVSRAVGAAFARFADAGRILVGRDMRPSGPELADAFMDGVNSQGVDVVDLGLIPTDLLYFAAGRLDAPGATFTGSHNPAQYNGIKLCLSGARPVGEETGLQDILKTIDGGALEPAAKRGTRESVDLLDDYAEHVRSFIDVAQLRPLRVVADTANGMGGHVLPRVFGPLPFDLDILYAELDGTFPNHPADPIQPENLKDLQARVLETGADIGLAFDGDADRVFLVDEKANPVSGSTTTAMLAASILDKNPGQAVIHNLICSRAVAEVIREHGGTPIVSRVGHSFIKGEMAEHDAIFGGEHSAHYYFRDNYRADSGLIAAVVVLELLSIAAKPLSELRLPFERYAQSGEINTRVDDSAAVIDDVAAVFSGRGKQNRLDGLTVEFDDWWFNLRPSNTEPLLRLNLEATTAEDCQARVDEVLALVKKG